MVTHRHHLLSLSESVPLPTKDRTVYHYLFSFLGNYSYDFPQPIPLKKKLKDYLEDNVDEKYYINNEKADKLIKQLIDNGTLPKHNLDRQTCVDGTINKPQE